MNMIIYLDCANHSCYNKITWIYSNINNKTTVYTLYIKILPTYLQIKIKYTVMYKPHNLYDSSAAINYIKPSCGFSHTKT